ncbi:hypothetical protein EBS40_09520 [bacterium]|nr:hypothetical protein [bacterium]
MIAIIHYQMGTVTVLNSSSPRYGRHVMAVVRASCSVEETRKKLRESLRRNYTNGIITRDDYGAGKTLIDAWVGESIALEYIGRIRLRPSPLPWAAPSADPAKILEAVCVMQK